MATFQVGIPNLVWTWRGCQAGPKHMELKKKVKNLIETTDCQIPFGGSGGTPILGNQEVFCQVRYQVLGEKSDGPCVLMLHGLLVNVSWLESSTEDQGLRPQWLWKMTFRLDEFFWFNCFGACWQVLNRFSDWKQASRT